MIETTNEKLCECGCGRAFMNPDRWGRTHRFVHGHNCGRFNVRAAGESNPFFGKRHSLETKKRMSITRLKGEPRINHDGYVLVWVGKDHPMSYASGHVLEHRLVMADHLGRVLGTEEVVHHVNGDKQDNRLENLDLLPNAEHVSLHRKTAKRD